MQISEEITISINVLILSSTHHAMVAINEDIGGGVADALDNWRSKDCVEESTVA